MRETEIYCPFCEKTKIKIKYDNFTGRCVDVQGAKWEPLLAKISDNEWVKDSNRGIAVTCKCRSIFFIDQFSKNYFNIRLSQILPIGRSLAVYCHQCNTAFLDSELVCPTCKSQY